MIYNLRIKNVILIDELDVDFSEGLNILTGETGAGKSMVIESIHFILGVRPAKDFIRAGSDMAEVFAALFINNEKTREAIREMGIEMEDDNMLLISRNIYENGKGVCRINGRTATVGMLREIASYLFDMHGQHEHQSLLNSNKHIELLDRFCDDDLGKYKNKLNEYLKKHREILKSISDIDENGGDLETRIDIYKYQINEIEQANLKENEEEALYARKKILNNSAQIAENTKGAILQLYEGGNEGSALDKLAMGKSFLEQLAALDDSCDVFSESIESIYIQLDDLLRDINKYSDNLQHDPNEIFAIENRLDMIYKLKKKYGKDTKEILIHLQKTKERLEIILNSGELLKKYAKQKQECEEKIIEICEKISVLRKECSKKISVEIENTLRELGMNQARFDVEIERKPEFDSNGFDKVEFLISPNVGEELKPLSKIASGGEISRVMLALKTVLAPADTIETFVFDEIDTGVSGRTAQKVAEKLSLLSKSHQLICITHLPQIASMADFHFLIEKKSEEEKTTTRMFKLTEEKTISELARLIGGAKITQSTIKAAEEMKQMAKSVLS